MPQTYENIDRSYGPHLERTSDNLVPAADTSGSGLGVSESEDGAGTTSPTGSGGTEPVIKNESQFTDLWIQNTIKSLNWKPKKQGFFIDGASGYAEFSNIFVAGDITASSGTIAGWTIEATQLSSGNVKIQSLEERILMGAATAIATGTGIFLGKDGTDYKLRVGNPLGAYILWDGSVLAMQGGVVTSLGSGTDLAIMGWQSNVLFSSEGSDTVNWLTGTISFQNGVAYSVGNGTTGEMTELTYIYLDTGTSVTALQTTTTASDAIGPNKVIIAVAKNNSEAGKSAIFQVFGGSGGMSPFITADNIAANSITANEIAANSITANELSSNLIFAGALTVDTNGHIKGGQTAFNTGQGFFIGYSGGDYKLSIGDPAASYLNWTGSELQMRGSLDVGTNGIINNSIYTVASLPVPPTITSYLNPSAYE